MTVEKAGWIGTRFLLLVFLVARQWWIVAALMLAWCYVDLRMMQKIARRKGKGSLWQWRE
jgi:hypothetical protein